MPSGSSNGRPSASTIVIGPDDLVGPVRPHGDRDVAHRPSLARRASPLQSSRVASHLPRDAPRVVGAARHERARRRPRRSAPGTRSHASWCSRRRRAPPTSSRAGAPCRPVSSTESSPSRARCRSPRARPSASPSAFGRTWPRRSGAETSTSCTASTPVSRGSPTWRSSRRRRQRPRRSSIPSVSPSRPGRNLRDRLLARIDRLVATSDEVAERAAARFPGSYTVVPAGVDLERFAPAPKSRVVVIETSAGGLPDRPLGAARAPAPRRLGGRPAAHGAPRGATVHPARAPRPRARPHRGSQRGAGRDPARGGDRRPLPGRLATAARRGLRRGLRDRGAPGRRRAAGAGRRRPPAVRRGRRSAAARRRRRVGRRSRTRASTPSRTILERLYVEAQGRRRAPRRHETEPLADRDWIVADLHMHTNWSHDCSIEPAALVDTRRGRRARDHRGDRPQRLRRGTRGCRARP